MELVHLIHDEVGLLVTAETAQATIEVVRQSFQEAFAEIFGNQLTVQLEPQLSDSWASFPRNPLARYHLPHQNAATGILDVAFCTINS